RKNHISVVRSPRRRAMNKSELVEAVASATNSSKAEAQANVDAVIDAITDALKKGDKVSLTGFGTFEVRNRAARTARNPQTGETIQVKASKAPAFKAGKGLKHGVNRDRQQTLEESTRFGGCSFFGSTRWTVVGGLVFVRWVEYAI